MYAVRELPLGRNSAPGLGILCPQPVQPRCEGRRGAIGFLPMAWPVCGHAGILAGLGCSYCGREDLLVEGRDGGPAVCPDRVDRAAHRSDALIVSVLVAQVGAAAGLVGGRGRDLHVLAEGKAAVGRPGVEDVRAQVRWVVSGVVPGHVHRAVGPVDRDMKMSVPLAGVSSIHEQYRLPRFGPVLVPAPHAGYTRARLVAMAGIAMSKATSVGEIVCVGPKLR